MPQLPKQHSFKPSRQRKTLQQGGQIYVIQCLFIEF